MLRIAVIGAGVVGASVAFRLAHRARVWLIDKSGPGSGTTSASFAWANANEKTPYEAVTHSGVTLGPILGRLLAREILAGEVDSMLAPFRSDRFARDQEQTLS